MKKIIIFTLLMLAVVQISSTAVSKHGRLQVQGNKIVNQHGQVPHLRGMALFWSQWMGQFWNKLDANWIYGKWDVDIIRCAMGVDQGGYLTNPDAEKAKVFAVVDACIANDIYVVIDWHVQDNTYTDQAKDFFKQMSQKYGQYPHVLYETWNEPTHFSWSQVKSYHEQIIPIIRQNSQSLIICGTPTWSQDVDQASQDPISDPNVAYTLHFYAATHKQSLRDKGNTAMANGIALFITEWGTCEASGNGSLDLNEATTWLNWADQHGISTCNWGIYDKAESCAALKPGASQYGGWTDNDLTTSGRFVRDYLVSHHGDHPTDSTKFSCDSANKVCQEDANGSQGYTDCYNSCVGGVTPSGVTWGQPCANKNDGDCGDNCDQCVFSWPQGSSYNDPNAKCRCKSGGAIPAVTYTCDSVQGRCLETSKGEFKDNSTCNSTCSSAPKVKYACDGSTGSCTSSESGTYDDKNTCDNSCTVTPTTSYDCYQQKCVESPYGQYKSLGSCQTSCDSTSYIYGQSCSSPSDGQCGHSCTLANCVWSWPSNDPQGPASSDADCRCKASKSLFKRIFKN